MNGTQATFTMVLLFALRCVVPLAVVMGIGYAMNWLVDRWEAEAAVPTQKADRCWAFKQCDEASREECPGFTQQMAPCWLVRTRTEGHLPDDCLTCPMYNEAPSFA
ncbi:MAG: hypothetical protein H6654_03305 [Ardenticatenaceae bacterium]|nr:hypothetical protein [Anaerolineales bacterium]MCB8941220.1 hypothetical protein [Ardenticatenaceae bacterium]MCB8972559.1 hypothetical protein [Ardenticatenaceae bacterium]